MSLDRRRTPRVPCDLPAIWKRGHRTCDLRVRDLNADGMFLATDLAVDLNFLMDLTVMLPDGPLDLLAVARFLGTTRDGVAGVGVAIHAIEPDDRKRWYALYRTISKEFVAKLPHGIGRHLRTPTVRR